MRPEKTLITSEIPLAGGRTTVGVVRIGETVRRPQTSMSQFVHRLLESLEANRFSGAPRFIGVDGREREILSFLPGEVPPNLGIFTDAQLYVAARLLRTFHDATQDLDLRGNHEVVCHGDASPCNAVFMDGLPYAWIDFDAAAPGARIEDLGYAAWLWLDIGEEEWRPEFQARRLAKFFSDYGDYGTASTTPVQAVLDAQARLLNRNGAPRVWAERCRSWTERHQSALSPSNNWLVTLP